MGVPGCREQHTSALGGTHNSRKHNVGGALEKCAAVRCSRTAAAVETVQQNGSCRGTGNRPPAKVVEVQGTKKQENTSARDRGTHQANRTEHRALHTQWRVQLRTGHRTLLTQDRAQGAAHSLASTNQDRAQDARSSPAKQERGNPKASILSRASVDRRDELLSMNSRAPASAHSCTASTASGYAFLPSCRTPNWSSRTP